MYLSSNDSRGHSQNAQKCNDIFRNPTGGHHNAPLIGLGAGETGGDGEEEEKKKNKVGNLASSPRFLLIWESMDNSNAKNWK